MKASLQPGFCCLSFPNEFNRARKNSVDLFKSLVLKKISGVRQFQNERCFALEFEGGDQLLFKMHGNRANVILAENNRAVKSFRNHLQNDLEINTEELDRTIDWSKENFLRNTARLNEVFFTLGKEIWNFLSKQGFDQSGDDEKWILFEKTFNQLSNPEFIVAEYQNKLIFPLLPFGKVVRKFTDPIEAVTEFFLMSSVSSTFNTEKSFALKQLHSKQSSTANFILKTQQKLDTLVNDTHYQVWADLLMANMHVIKPGVELVILENFYDNNRPISIKLKRDFSPQKNAEVFYRKGKNQQIELQKLKDSIAKKEEELIEWNQQILAMEESGELKDVRKKASESGLADKDEKQPKLLPFNEIEFKGYKIWVGRNAENNDTLTLKYSYKEDLWFHAKDVAGSHVLLKHQSGKKFPKEVIERAAQIAAYHSKRKNESLCPVIVTPKKYVRKRKGDPAGAVVVEREEVMLVEPQKN